MKNVLFIAPPAGGKGTQSELIVENYGYIHISTGDLLRQLDKTTPLGKEVDELLSQGKLISDEIVLELLKQKLSSIGGKPFILDGYPRNIHQALQLDSTLKELGLKLDVVIELVVPYETLIERVTGRISCTKCKSTFNKFSKKPIKEGICDKCGEVLTKRSDDDEETFKQRYNTYIEVTAPLIDFYTKRGILVKIDGVNNTFESLIREIKND